MASITVTRAPRSRVQRGQRPRRLLLFVHYNKWGHLADYVIYLLKQIRKIYARVVFISNSPLTEQAREKLQGVCDDILQRENIGFDFLAWKDALAREGREGLSRYDSVTLMNDSCCGPFFDLGAIYREMEAKGADFWGLTNHSFVEVDDKHPLGTDGIIPEHIQSYFLCFQRPAFMSDAFHSFWEQVGVEDTIEEAIRKYETQLTPYLTNSGLKWTLFCDTTKIEPETYSKQETHPELLLQAGVPLVKIKAFFARTPAENAFFLSSLREYRYPFSLLHEHLSHHFSPETSLQVVGHGLEGKRRGRKERPRQRIALHIHAYYTDILRMLLQRVRRHVRTPLDIFITTSSDEKAAEIQQLAQKDFPQLHVRRVLVCENCGRDVWPWLKVAPLMADYDVAGHLHTKKSPNTNVRFGPLWREELLECLVNRFPLIEDAFARDPKLGIVIPDIPSIFRYPPIPYRYDTDYGMHELLPKIWKRLGCQRAVEFAEMPILVFSYGNMFWYRPQALEPLWQTPWRTEDMPGEPLPVHGTLLHALERLPVYVAWERGYDFAIVKPAHTPPPGFQADMAFCEYRKQTPQASPPPKGTKATILQKLHEQMRHHLRHK